MSLQVKDLSKSFSIRTLFSNVSFAVNPGERVALVGTNGSGKTTLMRIILGKEAQDQGSIITPRDSRIGYMPQEIFFADEVHLTEKERGGTLWELVSTAFTHLWALQKQIADIEEKFSAGQITPALQDQHDRLIAEFEHRGGYTWQSRTIRILKGLGFPEKRFHDPLATFSGGWQMRGFFARLLLSEPDFLLLDEPTNYLDISSIGFLENYLANYPGGILMVSHDRYFLDSLATGVVALVPEGARVYRGNYSDFLDAREQWAADAEAAAQRQDKERARVEKFIERFRYKASKASQVQSRIKSLDKMKDIQRLEDRRTLSFRFPPCPESGETVLEAEKISRRYGDLRVLSDLDFRVYKGDRLAIVGENGAGKSTLMRIISQVDSGFSGRLNWGYRVQPAYFAQDEEISFERDETIIQRMQRDAPFDMVPQLRNLLGAFLFSGDAIDRPVRVLSGGEKSRLGLARLLLRPSNLLLLDEPTNHLDISSREALLQALLDFPGTLVVVSHDRFFIDALATRVIALSDGKAEMYQGTYSEYLWARERRGEGEGAEDGGKSPSTNEATAGESSQGTEKKDDWKARKRESNRRQRIEREIGEAETLISTLENRLRDLENRLATPETGCTREALTELSREHGHTEKTLAAAMERWEDLQRQLSEGGE